MVYMMESPITINYVKSIVFKPFRLIKIDSLQLERLCFIYTVCGSINTPDLRHRKISLKEYFCYTDSAPVIKYLPWNGPFQCILDQLYPCLDKIIKLFAANACCFVYLLSIFICILIKFRSHFQQFS